MPEKLWREATIDDANPQQMWVVPVERCEHGKIDGHEQWSKGETRAGWCDGAGIGGGDD